MRLNKKVQYGLLFALYIVRGGRVTVEAAADSLGLSKSFLEQVARLLRIKGIVCSIRGPSGGFEIVGEPTVLDILNALDPIAVLSKEEAAQYTYGTHEHRALLQFAVKLNRIMTPTLRQKIKNVALDLVLEELGQLDAVSVTERGN